MRSYSNYLFRKYYKRLVAHINNIKLNSKFNVKNKNVSARNNNNNNDNKITLQISVSKILQH